jgi:hypothetical protein
MHAAPRAHRSLRVLVALGCLVPLGGFAQIGCVRYPSLPASSTVPYEPDPSNLEQSAIEKREICVGSSVESVGELGDTLYYRASVLPDGKLAVGYYAFFSEERPWGNNWLTWTLLPALAMDFAYTRAVFVGPGLQRAIHGKGDVEGFTVIYDMRADGTLKVDRAIADDGTHAPVYLSAEEVMTLDPRRPTLYTDVWSHQLGGRGVRSTSELAYLRCYGPGRVRELPEAISIDYGLSHRAQPAHIDALGGIAVGGPARVEAKASPPRRPDM